MFIYNWEKRFDRELTDLYEWVSRVNFYMPPSRGIFENYCSFHNADERALEVLNLINPNILTVNIKERSYSILCDDKEKLLSIDYLCMTEKFFLLCRMANDLGEHVIVSNELAMLSVSNVKNFVKLFGHSPYIDLCPTDAKTEMIYRKVLDDFNKGILQ